MGWAGALVGGFLGAVATYFTWDPEYIYYGWTVGAAIGSAVEASNQTIRVQGPKLNDLTVQTSTYGGMVPIHFGTVGVVGNPIDLDVITPHSKNTSSGGKGGPKTVSTTTTYTTSTAILLGEGECLGIRKIWVDGKLKYSVDSDAVTLTAPSGGGGASPIGHLLGSLIQSLIAGQLNFKFYSGSETQLPDPTLEAIHGVGNVPAYRGTAYVVFTDNEEILNGNALRQLKFELVYVGTHAITNLKWEKGPASQAGAYVPCGPQSFIPNDSDEILLMKQSGNFPVTGYASSYEIWSITPTSQTLLRHIDITDMAYPYGATAGSADEVGHLRPWVSSPSYVFQGAYRWIYPDTVLDSLGYEQAHFSSFITGLDFVAFNPVNVLAFSKLGNYMLLLGARAATPGTLVLVDLFDMSGTLIAARDFTATVSSGETIRAVVMTTTGAWVISDVGGNNILRKCSLVDLSTLATVTYGYAAVIPGGTGEGYGYLFQGLTEICLAGDGFYLRKSSGTYGFYVLKVDALGVISIEGSDGLVTTPPPSGTGIGPDIAANQVDLYGSAFGYNPSTQVATFMGNENVSPGFYIWPYTVALRALTGLGTTVGATVATLSERVGYTAGQYDVTQIPDPLPGYSIATVAPTRAAIEPLLKFACADSVDSDGKTKYVKRGGAPVFTVEFDDLCAHETGAQMPEPFPLVRTQEVELPSKITVNYKNPLADYETGSEVSPQRSTTSQNPVVDELPIVMLPQKAAEIASVLYFDQIIQRQPRSFTVLKKFDFVEPTDPGWVEYPRGTFNPVRIVKREENGPVLKFECVPEDADSYTPNTVASSIQTGQTGIALAAPSSLVLLDIPILRDSDDDAGLYEAISSPSGNGAVLYRSTDDLNYVQVGVVDNSATTGLAVTALGNWTGGDVLDNINSVDVAVNGPLSSATEAAVLADPTLNAFAIGVPGKEEIGQFKTATLLSAGNYRLSGLLRGRRGTEWATGLHAASDRFVLLGSEGMLRTNEGASAIGAPRYYKVVSVGRSLDKTYSQSFTNTAVGLKPLSPINLSWGVNAAGDYLINAQRRSRLQARQGIFWDLPLGEASELYDLAIYSDAGYTTLKRTISNATGLPITYTAAMQTTDFGSVVRTALYFMLYQRSATVGRGYPATLAAIWSAFAGTWNPADAFQGDIFILSNHDASATFTNAVHAAGSIRATQSLGTGKVYFEIWADVIGPVTSTYVGFCDAATVLSGNIAGGSGKKLVWYSDNGASGPIYGDGAFIINAGGYGSTAVLGFYVDQIAGKAWGAKNNVLVRGDPVAGTLPLYTFTPGTVFYPVYNIVSGTAGQLFSLHLSAASQAYTPLIGYAPAL